MQIENIVNEIKKLSLDNECVLVAIDGRCAAGKTTLATNLEKLLDCNVFHMDHFFLRPEQRTKERMLEPGGNVDYERFLETVIGPLRNNEHFQYKPFDCKTFEFKEAICVNPKSINIIEGSYSCHPELFGYYDMRIFLDVNENVQLKRLAVRNKEMLDVFVEKWIPLEEQYFSTYQIKEKAGIVLDTSEIE